MEHLVPSFELCKAINNKYPLLKSSFSWYVYNGVSVSGGSANYAIDATVGQKVHYKVGLNEELKKGLNLFQMKFVSEIVPAYTLQDIVDLYYGSERIRNVQQVAEFIVGAD